MPKVKESQITHLTPKINLQLHCHWVSFPSKAIVLTMDQRQLDFYKSHTFNRLRQTLIKRAGAQELTKNTIELTHPVNSSLSIGI